jgi:hypothetical protein
MPLGKYSRIKPLAFSLKPRCQGLCGSQTKDQFFGGRSFGSTNQKRQVDTAKPMIKPTLLWPDLKTRLRLV